MIGPNPQSGVLPGKGAAPGKGSSMKECCATVFDRQRNELATFPASKTIDSVSGDDMLDFDADYLKGRQIPNAYGICWNYKYDDGSVTGAIESLYY